MTTNLLDRVGSAAFLAAAARVVTGVQAVQTCTRRRRPARRPCRRQTRSAVPDAAGSRSVTEHRPHDLARSRR